jgi:hypothetical protein
MRFPGTLLEFQAQFPDEASCWVYLREARWPQGFPCPRCASRGSHFLATRRLEQCRSCRDQGSVTAGAVFHDTRVPLRVWFLGVFFPARHKKGISALQFQRDTGVGSYQTAWTLLHKLRPGLVADPTRRLQGAGWARPASRSPSNDGPARPAPCVSLSFLVRRPPCARRSYRIRFSRRRPSLHRCLGFPCGAAPARD